MGIMYRLQSLLSSLLPRSEGKKLVVHVTEFRIARPELADVDDLLKIIKSTGFFDDLNPESEECRHDAESVLNSIMQSRDRVMMVARDEQGHVIGYVAMHFVPYLILRGEEGYLNELFVMSSYRSQGIGSMLLEAAVNEARDRGCKRLHLINSKRRDSYKRGFYSKRGWRERDYCASFVLNLEERHENSESVT